MSQSSAVLLGPAPVETPGPDFETTKEIGYYRLVWRRFASRRIALVAAIVLGVLAVLCYVGPFFLPPEHINLSNAYRPLFTPGHLLGTDAEGRDELTRLLDGGRVSLLVGFTAMALTMLIATVIGALSGFFGGAIDAFFSAVTNAVLSIPSILLLVIFGKVFGQGVPTVVIGIAVLSWPYTARIVRSVILSLREKEFVEAARALGTGRLQLMTRHLVPNALGPIIVSASLTVGQAILLESALSYLGLGIAPPAATWGRLLDEARDQLGTANGILLSLWPGLLILVTVLAFNYIGDALRDAFDPRALER